MAYRLVLGYAFVRRESEQNSSLQLNTSASIKRCELVPFDLGGMPRRFIASSVVAWHCDRFKRLARRTLSSLFQAQGETSPGKILGHHCRSLAVIGSREDFHLQGRCQAGRTNESAPIPGRSQIASSQVFRRRAWSAGPPGLCWNSRSGSPEASLPLGSRARGRCARARSLGWHP